MPILQYHKKLHFKLVLLRIIANFVQLGYLKDMKTNSSFAISFYLRKDKTDDQYTAPIFMRVTVNGERAIISTNRRISINKWKDGQAIGSSNEAKSIRDYIESIRTRIYNINKDLNDHDEIVTAEIIKDRFFGKRKISKKLKEVFDFHNDQMEELVGKDYSPMTLKRYRTAKRHVFAYIEHQYKCDDISLSELRYSFITGFEHYMKVIRNCNHNSTMKYIKNFRKVINLAVKYEWLERDPFSQFSCKTVPVVREFLSAEELESIENADIKMPRIDHVRDVFVFCCYTGLAHVDVLKLNKDNIYKGIDGSQWISINRTKTDTNSRIPLLPKAVSIINKYKDLPNVQSGKSLLPTSSNQKMNAYLKEIADICGINKNLTFHIARHTFATTVTLTNGVPIETVSFMLGHKSLRSTQIYSKVVEQKVSNDMSVLNQKLLEKSGGDKKTDPGA